MHRDRNPWQQLTTTQVHELDEATQLATIEGRSIVDAYRVIALQYAERCATLLNDNDLRGAMSAAEIAAAAKALARQREDAEHNARERINALRALEEGDPRRDLVTPAPTRWSEKSRRKAQTQPRDEKTQRFKAT